MSVIPDDVSIEDSYSTYLLLCQVETLKAHNVTILEELINKNSRWGKKYRLKGLRTSFDDVALLGYTSSDSHSYSFLQRIPK